MIKTYICDDCGYEAEMEESEYDGMCPACHEHHGFYEVEPSDTYTTGHNENETTAFEKLKMIEPLDRAVVFRKSKDELYIKVSDIGKVCDPYKDHDVKQYTTEEIAKKIIDEANKACAECQEENCWECEYRNWRGVKR